MSNNPDYLTYRFTLIGSITVPVKAYPALEVRNGPEGRETYRDASFEQLKALGVDYELENCLLERSHE